MAQVMEFVFNGRENIEENGENAGYHQLFPFPIMVSEALVI